MSIKQKKIEKQLEVIASRFGSCLTLDDWNKSLVEIGIDSLRTMELVLMVEDEFKLELPVDELNMDNLSTMKSLLNLIYKYSDC